MHITPSGKALGADISGVSLAAAAHDPDAIATIRQALLDHLVLRFRGQDLTDPDLMAFAGAFGDLDLAPINPYGNKPYLPDFPKVGVISNIVVDGRPQGSLGSGESKWHSDMTYKADPPMGCVLYALEVPAEGGNTGFANMYAAYAALPEHLKRAVQGRSAKHDSSINSAGQTRHGFKDAYDDPADIPGAVHPLVRRHPETGRPALFLGRRRNSYVIGMDKAGSDALLDELWAFATRPEFTWTQEWRVRDVLMWDNRATLHRRDAIDPAKPRMMHRAQIRDAAPVTAA